jgi:chloramphenicol O-acetyltransferase
MKVYIVNKSGHNYEDALRFGKELIFLTEGRIKQISVNNIYREVSEKMKDSSPDDYLIITSLPIISAIAASVLARKHGRLNLLIFKNGKYLERNISLDELCEVPL